MAPCFSACRRLDADIARARSLDGMVMLDLGELMLPCCGPARGHATPAS
jgi:hypothetical protein